MLSRDPLKDHCTDEVFANRSGYIQRMDTQALGNASMLLGAGRTTRIHRSIIRRVLYCIKTGMKVNKGDRLATLVAKDSGKMTQA